MSSSHSVVRTCLVDLPLEHSVFFVIIFKTMSNKTIIRFVFYDKFRIIKVSLRVITKTSIVVFHLFHSTQPVENHPYYHMASSVSEQDVPNRTL